jgi:L-threonylcarbamoyladenylate synthase
LTLVLPKKPVVPDVVTSGQPSVAVRMPAHPLFLRLLAETGTVLAAPSANPFGYVSPTTAEHVQDGLGKRIKYILDGGAAEVGVESTIVDLRDPHRPRLLRPGMVTKAELERVLGVRVTVGSAPRSARSALSAPRRGMIAPGMLTRHYSPQTPVFPHRKLSLSRALRPSSRQDAWVFLTRPAAANDAPNVFGWSAISERAGHGGLSGRERGQAQRARLARGSPGEDGTSRSPLATVAHNLFATLRRLDGQGWKNIHVEYAPRGGLGDAINDRLKRAGSKLSSARG